MRERERVREMLNWIKACKANKFAFLLQQAELVIWLLLMLLAACFSAAVDAVANKLICIKQRGTHTNTGKHWERRSWGETKIQIIDAQIKLIFEWICWWCLPLLHSLTHSLHYALLTTLFMQMGKELSRQQSSPGRWWAQTERKRKRRGERDEANDHLQVCCLFLQKKAAWNSFSLTN